MSELTLQQRMRYKAQNDEMIDQHFTEAGKLLNEGAAELDAAKAREEAVAEDNRALRRLAWASDPSPEKYGDDGELQAGRIDYLRMSVAEIDERRMRRGMDALAASGTARGSLGSTEE